MKSLLKTLASGLAAVSLLIGAVACSSDDGGSKPEYVAPVEFKLQTGGTFTDIEDGQKIALNSSIYLSSATEGVEIYYTKTTMEADNVVPAVVMDSSNAQSLIYKGEASLLSVTGTVSVDVAADNFEIYAVAKSESGKLSAVTKISVEVAPVPTSVVFTPTAEAVGGKFTRGTTVTLSSTSAIVDDTITIYYSLNSELSESNYTKIGTLYETALTINDYVTYYAIAVNENGCSVVSSCSFDVPVLYIEKSEEKNYGLTDGKIGTVLDAIRGSFTSVTFDSITVQGYVVSASSSSLYIVDDNHGIQIYKSSAFSGYEIGDYVVVSDCTAGCVYKKSGCAEITSFNTVEKDVSKKTRNFYYTKIPSYEADFTSYITFVTDTELSNGDCSIYAFRGTPSEHQNSPDYVYVGSSLVSDQEKTNFGYVSKTNDGLIELSVLFQEEADTIEKDVPNVYNVDFDKDSDEYEKDTVVTLSCKTSDATIYYSTTEFTVESFTQSTDKSEYTQGNTVTIDGDKTIYAIATLTTDGQSYCSSTVTKREYLVKNNITYVEMPAETPTDGSFAVDGGIANFLNLSGFASAGDAFNISDGPTITGILTLTAESRQNWILQDKDNSIYFYNVALPFNARVGDKVSVKPTEAQNRYGSNQVTKVDTDSFVVTRHATSKIYYNNLSLLDDFTSYINKGLCALRGLKSDYVYSSGKNQTAVLTSYNSNSLILPSEEKTFFGYVEDYSEKSGSTHIELYALSVQDAETINYPTNITSNVKISDSGEFSGSMNVTLSCLQSDAEIFYQIIDEGDESKTPITTEAYDSATKYENDVTINKSCILYAIAVRTVNGKKIVSDVVSATYTLMPANVYNCVFADLGLSDKTDLSTSPVTWNGFTFTFASNDGSTPLYYSNGTNFRVYSKNTLIVAPTDSSKKITKIEFTWDKSNNPSADTDWTSSSGSYNISNKEWTSGDASGVESVTFTAGKKMFFTSVKITTDEQP